MDAMTERDWVEIVARGTCPECGLAARQVARADLPSALKEEGRAWGVLLRTATAADLRTRPLDGGWSALEYGAHVRDVLDVFAGRAERVVAEDRPVFGWWDHEAAAVEERYNEQRPEAVASELEVAALHLASVGGPLEEHDWLRAGTRRDNETFTVEALLRFALHEAHHHRVDASRSLGASGRHGD